MKNLIQKWEKTGLLDHTDPENTDNVSKILNSVALILIKKYPNTDSKEGNELAGIILPIIERLYKKIGSSAFPNENWLVNDCLQFLNNHRKLYEVDTTNYGEIEFGSMYCEDVVERLKTPIRNV